jgi:hypothetical protein
MEDLQLEHTPEQWTLFIDSHKVSLKAVLRQNGNNYPSLPLAHAVHVKGRHENLQILLQKARYE